MMRTIILREEQLREYMGDTGYSYLSDTPFNAHRGQQDVTADGVLDGTESAMPTTGDDVSANITPQFYGRRFGMAYGHPTVSDPDVYKDLDKSFTVSESANDDTNRDGVDDSAEAPAETGYGLDTYSNNKQGDDLVKIPQGVQQKTDVLLDAMRSSGLSDKQCAMVLNKIIENMNLSTLPEVWKKVLRRKLG